METKQYLEGVLKGQNLNDDSQELKDLQKHRSAVEGVLRKGFPKAAPTIQYGGSRAKGTLILESFDLDIACYFPNGDTSAGSSLKEIFQNVKSVLDGDYYAEPKTSAIRLRDKKEKIDFHIDVVPGRYVDDTKSDCFLYQNGAEKDRLKTNLGIHVAHVKDSGVVPTIRLSKLWKTRRGLTLKQFVFELLVIKLLKDRKNSSLESQLTHIWTTLKDTKDPISVEDPANPNGNDLTELIRSAWTELSNRSSDTLRLIEQSGWEAVFGPVSETGDGGTKRIEVIRDAAAAVITPSKSWNP